MIARNKHFGNNRRTTLRSRIGIATAVLVSGGAIAAGAVVATNHGAPAKVQAAGYTNGYANNEWNTLNSALNNWGWSRQSSYNQLARLTQVRTFNQTWQHGKMLAVQRGIVVLATKRFIILRSANGSLHLWLVSGATKFQNVSTTKSGMTALTANTTAANQAMTTSMIPATTLLAGTPTTAAQLLTPAPAAQTVTVQVANTNLTVTVTVTRSTAMVQQTATTPVNAMPTWWQNTFTQNAWMPVNKLARGDLAIIAGVRSHWTLHAQLVLFAPLTTADVGGRAFTGTTTNGTNQGTTTGGTFTGTHS